ncbi:MAG: Ig-like domain-containing protein, partial [Planctomycetota bacterium]
MNTSSFHRRVARARRLRVARRRLLIEPLEARQACGSLIPIPVAWLMRGISESFAAAGSLGAERRSVASANRSASVSPWRSALAMDTVRDGGERSPPLSRPVSSFVSNVPSPASRPNLFEQVNAPKFPSDQVNVRPGDWMPALAGGGSGGASTLPADHEPRSRDGGASAELPRSGSGEGSGGGGAADRDAAGHGAAGNSAAVATGGASDGIGKGAAVLQETRGGSTSDGASGWVQLQQPLRTDTGSTFVLNSIASDRWRFREFGGRGEGAGRLNGPLWMVEGNSFVSQLELDWERPSDVSRVQFQFRVRWDSDAKSIRDAFEAAWLDESERSLLPTTATGRDSFINATEGRDPLLGRGTSIVWTPLGTTWVGTVTTDVTAVPAGTEGTFVFRLINNDNVLGNDNQSYARLDLTNAAPVARDDAITLREDETFVLNSPGILANDTDRDDDPIQATLVAGPSHGVLDLRPDGSLRYTPHPNFAGVDRFEYRAIDGRSQSLVATVLLQVSPVNDPPIALDDHYSLRAGRTLVRDSEQGVLANDFDREGDSFVAALVTGSGKGPAHGQIELRQDGSFVYTPDPGWTGNDYFTYTVTSAGIESEPARVWLRTTPGIANIVVDSTRWRNGFPFASPGFVITDTTRNLPWFNINQVRIEFTEPVAPIQPSDIVWRGSPTLGIDYQSWFQIAQPHPNLLELTLGDNQIIATDRILIGLQETIRDADGNALDGNGDGIGGDPANLRFNVARGDVNNSGLVLSSDVTLVRNSQLGLGVYDPFHDVNGTGLILSDDVTLTRNNQLGLPGSDRALTALTAPLGIVAISQSAKFFVADTSRRAYRYQPDGGILRAMDLPAALPPSGIAMTADGSRLWTVSPDHRVTVYEAASGLALGSWNAGIGTAAEGVAVDGAHVWLIDAQSDRLEWYAYAAQRTSGTLAPDRVFPLSSANTTPTGIATNGSVILVSDSEADRVFVYSMTGEALGNWALDSNNRDAVGITLDPRGGSDVWVVDRSERRVFTYQGGLQWRTASSPASGSFPLADSQGEPSDIADPPPVEPLSQYPIETIYGTTSFDQDSDVLHVDLSLIHQGNYTLRGPIRLGMRNLSRADVRWIDSDGFVDGSIPYVDLARWLANPDWKPGQASETMTLRFHNPNRAPFEYELVLFPLLNEPPRITSDPVLYVRPNEAHYRYDVRAVDPNQDTPLTYALISHPEGMEIDPLTGRIQWTTGPGSVSVGTHRVEVRVSDPEGLSDIQGYNITVLPIDYGNRPPVWVSDPIVSAFVQTDYVYPSQGSDVDGDRVHYSILRGPQGMGVDAETGMVRWRPSDAELGWHDVVLRVRDDVVPSLWSDQSFQILVARQPGNRDPRIVSQPRPIHNVVSPNPATGPVAPAQPIVVNLNDGETSTHNVTYTRSTILPQADVLFLLDDTSSMDNWGSSSRPGSIALLDTFMQAIQQLDAAYPSTDFAFGMSRLENFALSDSNSSLNRPFVLNQPLLRREDSGFERFLQQALLRRAPGGGAGTVSIYEALYQAATGVGLDYGSNTATGKVGPLNNSTLDYGHSLDISGQTFRGSSGDVAAFNTPRSFSYRILNIGDYPLLSIDSTSDPHEVVGNLNEPRSATLWRFRTTESNMRLQLKTPEAIASSEWILMNPSGAKMFASDANADVEIALAEPGEYVLVLNSQSDSRVSYRAQLKLRRDETVLPIDRDVVGQLQLANQVDRYSFQVNEWSTVYLDLMTRSTGLTWRWISPDGTIRASQRFYDSKGEAVASSNEPLLRLAPGTYRLEIVDSDPFNLLGTRDYRFAVRTLPSANAIGTLSAGDPLNWEHAPERRSSARVYQFQSPIDRHRIAITVPNAATDPGVRQWVLDGDGHVLHFASTVPGEISSDSDSFIAARTGTYFVVVDGDATTTA